MDNPYKALAENLITKNFGGRSKGSAEPLITGYHFIQFVNLPDGLQTEYANMRSSGTGKDSLTNNDIATVLSAAALQVTTPGGRLNHVDLMGMGGIKWTVPTNIDYDTSFNVKFLEFNNTPIFNIVHSWIQMIRDYRTGISALTGTPNSYKKSNYSATAYYFTLTPNFQDINYYACFDGIYPITDPHNLYGSNIEDINKLDVEIEFKFDYMWTQPWVYDKCTSILASVKDKISALNISNL